MATISDNITLRHHCISFIEYVLYTLKFRHLLENETICESVLSSPEIPSVNAVPCCGPEHPQRGGEEQDQQSRQAATVMARCTA